MSISVTINAESAEAARAEMQAFLGGAPFVGETGNVQPGVVAASTIQAPADKPKRGRSAAPKVTDAVDENAAPQAIQSGGERDDPNAKAATDVEQPKPKLLTVDDVRAAAKPYIDKFTMAAASKDLTPCLEKATGCKAISELADKDQATLQKAIDAFTAAGKADTRYGAEAVLA